MKGGVENSSAISTAAAKVKEIKERSEKVIFFIVEVVLGKEELLDRKVGRNGDILEVILVIFIKSPPSLIARDYPYFLN